jgi:(1->4)-alpha-D-glucan 1-alpha-D-glucosylmutase
MITVPEPPVATCRLQFNRNFTFADARAIVDYLHRLGISHIYASPYLKARPGSAHGYDIVDHEALNPEIGDEADYEALIAELRRHGMGQILDVVPNHMAVGGSDNAWWQDVLEHGESSRYAGYFDIDWRPADPALRGRVLLPFLGDYYGKVIERGELEPAFDPDSGTISIAYYGHYFPLDPRSYPAALAGARALLDETNATRLDEVLADFAALPPRDARSSAERQRRAESARAAKTRLAGICAEDPAILEAIQRALARLHGKPGQPSSFDALHELLEAQAWRPAFWQVATDQINYRRFFDINELAGLRVECQDVFDDTHRLVARLLAQGAIDGLRIDHPDGLADPQRYFERLQELAGRPLYVVAEKILAGWEHLPPQWPIAGTTGYDFAGTLNGLFVWPYSERRMNRIYRRFTGLGTHFDELLHERKKYIIRGILSAELSVLGNLLYRIAQDDRNTRDFTRHGLLDAITETVACFPVYRTYVTANSVSAEDRRYVGWAIAQAIKRSPHTRADLYEWLHDTLLLADAPRMSAEARRERLEFTRRFQQYTAPVMAKGMEDTAFYIHNRLVSLNDVGFDPRVWSVSTAAFHHQNRLRLGDWPDAMTCTSTHDSKRGEDTRARIDVLSEIPEIWQLHLSRWARINRMRKLIVDGKPAPSRNDEYLLYQTLFGIWPLDPEPDLEDLRARLESYMIKAAREAKLHTSWMMPAEEYEEALRHFTAALVHDPERNPFLADFIPFVGEHMRHGLLNGLSQTLLRLTAPGVPDTYQGCELWCCSLVDPDNRHPVDYAARRRMLDELEARIATGGRETCARELLGSLPEGRAKLYVTWLTLQARRAHAELYRRGDYEALEAMGPRAEHVCAFARAQQGRRAVSIAGRWFARLHKDQPGPPVGEAIWRDTWLPLPEAGRWRDAYTGRLRETEVRDGMNLLSLPQVFDTLPLALLLPE